MRDTMLMMIAATLCALALQLASPPPPAPHGVPLHEAGAPPR